MHYKLGLLFWVLLLSIFAYSCVEEDPIIETTTIEMNISGLEDLGPDFVYSGWLISNGFPERGGDFTVDGNGNLSKTTFEFTKAVIDDAATYVLTIEPVGSTEINANKVHVLAGDFSGDEAEISIDHIAAIGDSFDSARGDYILGTLTGDVMLENSGIWFVKDVNGNHEEGLHLPALPESWIYEAWVVVNGVNLSMGKFSSQNQADSSDTYSGNAVGPQFPGEDFLNNAPEGLTFPIDITGATTFISIEPVPDNSSEPFMLKPLIDQIPSTGGESTYSLDRNLVFPTGTITR